MKLKIRGFVAGSGRVYAAQRQCFSSGSTSDIYADKKNNENSVPCSRFVARLENRPVHIWSNANPWQPWLIVGLWRHYVRTIVTLGTWAVSGLATSGSTGRTLSRWKLSIPPIRKQKKRFVLTCWSQMRFFYCYDDRTIKFVFVY